MMSRNNVIWQSNNKVILQASLKDHKEIKQGAAVVKISKQSVKHEISPLVLQLWGQIGWL